MPDGIPFFQESPLSIVTPAATGLVHPGHPAQALTRRLPKPQRICPLRPPWSFDILTGDCDVRPAPWPASSLLPHGGSVI